MTEPQRALAHALLKTGLSAQGTWPRRPSCRSTTCCRSSKAAAAVPARSGGVLLHGLRHAGDKSAWGWRFEGHHISLRFDIVAGAMTASSPAFFGSNPAEVREGPQKGTRVLGAEEDAARALLDSLDAAQRQTAMVLPRRRRHPDDDCAEGRSVVAGGDQGDGADEGAAREADAAHRRLRRPDGARRRRRAHGAPAEGRASTRSRSRGRDRSRRGRSTTTGCRDRPSWSSTTTRRTTATTSTPSGVISTATSAAICSAST